MRDNNYLTRREKGDAKLKLRAQAHYLGLLVDALVHSVRSGAGTLVQDKGTYIFTTTTSLGKQRLLLDYGIAEALKRRLAHVDNQNH